MNQELVDKIVRAVMYEGYMLYPYRPAVKNRYRWTFGTLFPQTYSRSHGCGDAWSMQTQFLVIGTAETRLRVRLRFLHLVNRTVGKLSEPCLDFDPARVPAFDAVDSLTTGDDVFQSWQETVEQDILLPDTLVGSLLDGGIEKDVNIEAAREIEPLRDRNGIVTGLLLRERKALSVVSHIEAQSLEADLFKVTIQTKNETGLEDALKVTRDQALARSLLSCHLLLSIERGEFVSLIDPPARLQTAAQACRSAGVFPVLIGATDETDAMLCSPIILHDYPQLAPESVIDFFDACEMDEMLTLRIATLTDREKHEMAMVDARTQAMLTRTESLMPNEMAMLHGAVRQLREVEQAAPDSASNDRRASTVSVMGVTLRAGDHVRLRPHRSADAFDVLLTGRVATIVSIEQDFENRVHVTVTLDDDPGADLGAEGKIGHRFFFFVDEIEPLTSGQITEP